MKLMLTLAIIGGTLLTLLTPSILTAQNNDYGTNRKLRTCPSRSEPKSGSISAAQAKIYVACSVEEKRVFNASVQFVDILSLQVAPKSRRVKDSEFRRYQIDIEKPVYDIRGSMILYTCQNTLGTSYPRGQNCIVYREPKSSGMCYQTTFGDWYCSMGGSSARPEPKMPAPD
jgi:hypothetical protein